MARSVLAVSAKDVARRMSSVSEGSGALIMRGIEFGAAGLVRIDPALEHEMARDAVFAAHHARKASPQLLGLQVGQETQPAQVHTQHRHLSIAHLPYSTKNGPIAAEHQGEVGDRLGTEVGCLQ